MSVDNFASNDVDSMKCWPLAGFAAGLYSCRCMDCERSFLGAKRSSHCLECSINSLKAKIEMDSKIMMAMSDVPQERIVAAAIFHGATISLPPPARHHTILNFMATTMGVDAMKVDPVNQGFLTNRGRFVNRTEAYYIALKQKQIIKKTGNEHEPTLYSEDVW